jgi:hypothetical protein
LCDALLEADNLLPEPISFGRDRNDTFSHLRDVVLPAKSFTALSLDSTVGAHPLSVVGPLAWPTGTVLSHEHNFRTFVYPSTHSHICTSGSCTPRFSATHLPDIYPAPVKDRVGRLDAARTDLRSMLVGPSVLRPCLDETLDNRNTSRTGTIGADVQKRWK